jgi:hypothetical protein
MSSAKQSCTLPVLCVMTLVKGKEQHSPVHPSFPKHFCPLKRWQAAYDMLDILWQSTAI